jgi:signal transduction histidine kinase
MPYDAFLKQVPLFSELPDNDLEQLCQMVWDVTLEAGTQLFAEGDAGDKAYVVKEGELEIIKRAAGREVLLAVVGPSEIIGEMSLLENTARTASVRARSQAHLLVITPEQLDALFTSSPSAARSILRTVTSRWRTTEAMLRQNEKLAQLGTLSAGMAHELNNPAAAAQRGAAQLREAVSAMQHAQLRFIELRLTQDQMDILAPLEVHAQDSADDPITLDSMARSDREYEIETWLEENRGLQNAWELAPALANMGYDSTGLSGLCGNFAGDQLPAVLGWLVASYTAYSLLQEIQQGAGRISEIVKAMKQYVYLDQAPVQQVDVHEGLDNTLVLLRSKLKQGIEVHRDYASDLPRIEAYGSELNQVWTNIIDNAIDAMSGQGKLILHTHADGDFVVVELQDNGPGIPPEIVSKIFDPFFTTKAVGKGTGLGLNITYNIVVQKHRGDIKVFSEPGKTCFQVWLPKTQST